MGKMFVRFVTAYSAGLRRGAANARIFMVSLPGWALPFAPGLGAAGVLPYQFQPRRSTCLLLRMKSSPLCSSMPPIKTMIKLK